MWTSIRIIAANGFGKRPALSLMWKDSLKDSIANGGRRHKFISIESWQYELLSSKPLLWP